MNNIDKTFLLRKRIINEFEEHAQKTRNPEEILKWAKLNYNKHREIFLNTLIFILQRIRDDKEFSSRWRIFSLVEILKYLGDKIIVSKLERLIKEHRFAKFILPYIKEILIYFEEESNVYQDPLLSPQPFGTFSEDEVLKILKDPESHIEKYIKLLDQFSFHLIETSKILLEHLINIGGIHTLPLIEYLARSEQLSLIKVILEEIDKIPSEETLLFLENLRKEITELFAEDEAQKLLKKIDKIKKRIKNKKFIKEKPKRIKSFAYFDEIYISNIGRDFLYNLYFIKRKDSGTSLIKVSMTLPVGIYDYKILINKREEDIYSFLEDEEKEFTLVNISYNYALKILADAYFVSKEMVFFTPLFFYPLKDLLTVSELEPIPYETLPENALQKIKHILKKHSSLIKPYLQLNEKDKIHLADEVLVLPETTDWFYLTKKLKEEFKKFKNLSMDILKKIADKGISMDILEKSKEGKFFFAISEEQFLNLLKRYVVPDIFFWYQAILRTIEFLYFKEDYLSAYLLYEVSASFLNSAEKYFKGEPDEIAKKLITVPLFFSMIRKSLFMSGDVPDDEEENFFDTIDET